MNGFVFSLLRRGERENAVSKYNDKELPITY